jgi:hypothetical protein
MAQIQNFRRLAKYSGAAEGWLAWPRIRDGTVTGAKKRNRDAQFLNQFEETSHARLL